MGMAMNRFDMFCQLRDDIKRKSDLNRFVISAVIVHDNSDEELVNEIKANFIKWAELTGEKFLFVTFVPPSGEWRRSQYCIDAYWVDKHSILTDHCLSRKDEETTNSLLRDFFGLPSRGSYIVLADRLDSINPGNIPTSAESIGQQLERVTRYCNCTEEKLPSNFNRLVSELNGMKLQTSKSFIDILIDYASLISPLKAFGRYFGKRKQQQTAASVLKCRQAQLEKLDEETYFEEFSDFTIMSGVAIKNSYLKADRLRIPSVLEYTQNAKFHLLSEYSQTLYKTYRFLEQIMVRKHELRLPFNLDYSFLTLNLGKIIEYELNLSILQMLRAVLWIDMPSYYNKYSLKNGDVEISTGITTVNVNQPKEREHKYRDRSPLKGVPIGNLMYAYENMIQNNVTVSPAPNFDRLTKISEEALRFFKRFGSQCRNKASHIDLKSETTYKIAKDAFQEFLEKHLPFLYEMKISLSH